MNCFRCKDEIPLMDKVVHYKIEQLQVALKPFYPSYSFLPPKVYEFHYHQRCVPLNLGWYCKEQEDEIRT